MPSSLSSKPVRVLMDATAIPANLGGVGRYVDDLVPELEAQGVELTMAVQERDAEHFATRLPSARIIPISPRFESRPMRFAWEQTGLPSLIRKVRPDVLHSPTTPARSSRAFPSSSRCTTRPSSLTRRRTRA